jgi:hypothetical protein
MTKVAKHNKKRNVGLIHEQLVRYVASSLIAEDKSAAEKAVQIVAKHFKPGTELYREFRLFNALINMPVGSRSLAERILAESKRAASSHDPQQLRQEKSLLIKDINTGLAESRRFYDIKIENYRLFATVQTVLNEWRGKDKLDLTTRAMYEEQLVDWLARSTGENLQEKMDIDPLVQKLMYQKFESKYKEQLSESQKKILECSILGTDSEFIEIIKETKIRALSELDAYEKVCDNRLLKENIGGVRKSIESLPEEKNDVVIAKTLHLVHLIEEMKTDER